MNAFKTHCLLSYLCLASVSAAIVSPALPIIAHTMHLSHGALGWVTAIFLLGYGLGQLIYGPIANQFGRLFALRCGLLILILGNTIALISAYQLSFIGLIAGRFLAALGAASGLSCTLMLVIESLEKSKAERAIAYGPLYFTLGIGGAAFIGGWLTRHFGWQVTFDALIIHGIIVFGMSFLFTETLKDPIPLKITSILKGYSNALRSNQLLIFAFCVGVISIVAYCYSAAAPLYAAKVLHLNPSQYGQWNLFNMLGMGFSSIVIARVINIYGAKKLLRIALLGTLCCVALIILLHTLFTSHIWLFFSLTSAMYFFASALFPAGTTIASDAILDKGSASSMISFINIGSAFLSVLFMGYLPWTILTSFIFILSVALILALVLTEGFWLKQDLTSPDYNQ